MQQKQKTKKKNQKQKKLITNIFHHPLTFKRKLITKHLAKDNFLKKIPII
jgi:hypothetical protein